MEMLNLFNWILLGIDITQGTCGTNIPCYNINITCQYILDIDRTRNFCDMWHDHM